MPNHIDFLLVLFAAFTLFIIIARNPRNGR